MLKSMTGYGRGERALHWGSIVIEAKSVNHRYLDVSCKLPKRLSFQESQVRKIVASKFSRGRFDIFIQFDFLKDDNQQLKLNFPLAQQYYSILKELKDKLNMDSEISLNLLAGMKDVIITDEIEHRQEEEEKACMEALNDALNSLGKMRQIEGEALQKDLAEKLNGVKALIAKIKRRSSRVLISYKERLAKRVKTLSGEIDVDAQRLVQEIAFLAERSDISEELVRIKSHLKQLGTVLDEDGSIGRKIDFLIQEIHREINTIASKANDADISQRVVEIKSELEKMREQIQNIE